MPAAVNRQLPADVESLVERIDPARAAEAIAGEIVRTPSLACPDLAALAGGPVVLKAECLQLTGSFKLRGALNKVVALGDAASPGLVTASAGNHARALAQAARICGVGCEVFMPVDAPVSKVAAAEGAGASVRLAGASVDEALKLASERSEETGEPLVHPFDDVDVIAGQGTLGLELAQDVAGIARVLIPLGGGGLAAGVAVALRSAGVDAELVGVQAAACAPFAAALAGRHVASAQLASGATIADGIAVKKPGRITLPLVSTLLDRVVTVEEDDIAAAMVFLAETVKLVAEGAGAVGVAALLGGLEPVAGTTVVVVSGGNVDGGLLASLLRRHETEEGRRVRLFTFVPDRPGGLSDLLSLVASERANLVTLEHVREAVELHVRETGVELTLETRGREHTGRLVAALEAAGYEVALR
ncbi:MAG TPA: pyridoxal-phosphate dependent enzyme [Solirubrobacteraceae bacterium]|nr:pyridoxal-phosphate dependent enzyme [Solirubrobacteraceae bacterium]